jgi:hypothetical protein
MGICSTNHIIYANCVEFESIKELMDYYEKYQSQCPVPLNHGYIMFPDKISSSSAMVEVDNKTVFVGCPNYYYSYVCDSWEQALIVANNINSDWLESSLSQIEWLRLFNWDRYPTKVQ